MKNVAHTDGIIKPCPGTVQETFCRWAMGGFEQPVFSLGPPESHLKTQNVQGMSGRFTVMPACLNLLMMAWISLKCCCTQSTQSNKKTQKCAKQVYPLSSPYTISMRIWKVAWTVFHPNSITLNW